MTDLTEQWKKGELPSGFYYVKNEFGNIFPSDYSESYDSINDAVIKDFFTEISEITEVIAPVPSYDEWEKYKTYYDRVKLNGNYCDKISNLKAYIKRLTEEKSELQSQLDELGCEYEMLKELLKECKGLFNRSTVDGAEPSNGELIMILTKIEQVLGVK